MIRSVSMALVNVSYTSERQYPVLSTEPASSTLPVPRRSLGSESVLPAASNSASIPQTGIRGLILHVHIPEASTKAVKSKWSTWVELRGILIDKYI